MSPARDKFIMRSRIATALLIAFASTALADVVVMKDGRQLQGRSTIEGDEVVVRQKHGEVRVAKADVLRIDHEDDVYSQLERKEKDLANGTADERYELGVWARDHKLDDEARSAFLSVLKVDPDHAGARAALGYVREDGRWVTEEDQMRARGLVKFQGRWMTPSDKIKAEADLAEKVAKQKEAAKKAEEEKQLARAAKLQAEREARLARIQAYEEELARARARRRAEDEDAGLGFSYYSGYYGPGYYGPYGSYVGPYSFYAGPTNLSNNDLLIYAGYVSGRFSRRGLVSPTPGRVVTVTGGYGGGDAWGYGGGGFTGGTYSSFGVELSGSWTSRSGRTQVRFRTGF
jgi:hypothetical protein